MTEWLADIRASGLALSEAELRTLRAEPLALRTERTRLAAKYDLIKTEIRMKRNDLKRRYLREKGNEASLLVVATHHLKVSIEKLLIPLWIGGKWAFDGVPRDRPSFEHPVSCSHFVQKILTDAGLNIKRDGSTWLAYLSPKNIALSLQSSNTEDYSPCSKFNQLFPKDGERFYVIGLTAANCGTVMFGFETNHNFYLAHAGISIQGSGINYEEVTSYLCNFITWSEIYVAEIDQSVSYKWLFDIPIYPIRE